MSGQQKRGFRLPWTAERGPEDGSAAATMDADSLDSIPDVMRDDLGEGPFERAQPAPPTKSTGAVPAAPDAPDASAEAAMIEIDSPTSEPATGAPAGPRANGSAWPQSDQRAASRPPIRVESEPRVPRRENPLVAGLVKAMREAAIASREETTNRLRAEATTRMDAIRSGSTDAAADLRKRAEEDIAGIREWSKAEIARVRQQTEDRIEARRTELASETQRYAAGIDQQVEQVQALVAAFESETDGFFELLLSETDPARLATLAEQAPEPPDLTGEWDNGADWQDAAATDASEPVGQATPNATDSTSDTSDPVEAVGAADVADPDVEVLADASTEAAVEAPAADVETVAEDAPAMASAPSPEPLEADAAAEAEAAATEGLDMVSPDQWPAAVMGGTRRGDSPTPHPEPASVGATRLLVSGLTSVAGISAFKGAVGGLPGVRSVSVSSGERGVFIFSVSHEVEASIAEAVAGLTGFAVRITETTGDSVSITAHEPAA